MPRKTKSQLVRLANMKKAHDARNRNVKLRRALANWGDNQEGQVGPDPPGEGLSAATDDRVGGMPAPVGREECAVMETETEEVALVGGRARVQVLSPPRPTCFVCCGVLPLKTSKSKVNPPPPPELFQFILQYLLELPVVQATTYLAALDKPGNWIRLCTTCQALIVRGRDLLQEIERLQSQLRRCKKKIVGGMKETIDTPRAPMSSFSQNLTERRTLLQIQQFVKARRYAVLNPAAKTKRVKKFTPSTKTSEPLKKRKMGRIGRPKKSPATGPVVDLDETDHEDEDMIDLHDYLSTSLFAGDSHQGQGQDPLAANPINIKVEVDVEDDDDDPVHSSYSKNQIYCGLCEDSEVYENEADLISHTKSCHFPSQSHDPLSPIPMKEELSTASLSDSDDNQVKDKDSQPLEPGSKVEMARHKMKKRKRVNHDGLGKGTSPSLSLLRPSSVYGHYLYDCPNCPKVKKYSVVKYAQHLGIHLRRPYQCTKCLEFFPDDPVLQEIHWKDKHCDDEGQNLSEMVTKFIKIKFDPGKIWKCDNCFSGFFTEADRTDHELRCTVFRKQQQQVQIDSGVKKVPSGPRPYPCQLCLGMILRNFPEWRLHRAIHHPEVDKMSCYYCEQSFAETTVEGVEVRHDSKLLEHMVSQHTGDEFGHAIKIHLECLPCGLIFDKETLHNEHCVELHGAKSHHCEICGVSYGLEKRLRSHMTVTHFQGEASICDICGQDFIKRIQVAHHKLTEHGIEPGPEEGFKVLGCPQEGCNFRAVQPNSLANHVQSRHGSGTSRSFPCRSCGKTFKNSSHRRVHEEIHKNKELKPYQCDICGNSFAVRNYLYIHKRLSHEGRSFPSTNKKKGPRPRKVDNIIGSKSKSSWGNIEGPSPSSLVTQDNSGKMGQSIPVPVQHLQTSYSNEMGIGYESNI